MRKRTACKESKDSTMDDTTLITLTATSSWQDHHQRNESSPSVLTTTSNDTEPGTGAGGEAAVGQVIEWSSDNKTRNAVIGFLLLLINALTLLTVIRTRSLRPHIKMLVGSLTCTDMLMGVVTLAPRLLPWGNDLSHQPMCVVRYTGVLMSVYGTCLSVIAISLDRTLAISVPLTYRTSITVKKSVLVVVGVWGLSGAVTALTLPLVDGFPRGNSCNLILVLGTRGMLVIGYFLSASGAVVASLYVYLGMRIRRRRRRVATELGGGGGGGNSYNVASRESQTISLRIEKRTTVTAVVLAAIFMLGYLPVATYCLWIVYSGVDYLEEAKTQRLWIVIVCPLVNCILDPLVYFWRLQTWSSSLLGSCRKLVKRSAPESTTTGLPAASQSTRQSAL